MPPKSVLIKPSRTTDTSPVLNKEITYSNVLNKIETTVVLDLNILNLMRDVIQRRKGIEERAEEIADLIQFLNENPVWLTPGFALGEVDETYLHEIHEAYENFLHLHCPTYIDTPNATRNNENIARGRHYQALPNGDKRIHSIAYLALLEMHVIMKEHPKSSGETKFDQYLEYMDGVADMVPAIESEVAKYLFFDRRSIKDTALISFCKTIQENFDKGGRGETRLDRILNGARDLMYYRLTAIKDGKELDGVIQDTWLLTSDKAIVNLSNSIYFVPHDGERAKNVTLVRQPEQTTNSYWKYVDKYFESLMTEREKLTSRRSWSEKDATKLQSQIKNLEEKIKELYPAT